MRNWWALSSALLLLTGCYQTVQPETSTYAQSNPLAAPAAAPAPYHSYGQPTALTVPQTAPASYVPPVYTQPAQVPYTAPTYSPQPAQMPYAMPAYNQAPVMPAPQPSLIQTIVIPQQDSSSAALGKIAAGAGATSAPISTPSAHAQNPFYPSWARPINETPASSSENVLFLRRPGQTETVQCSTIDSMCIASYQQQGYQPIQGSVSFTGKNQSASSYPAEKRRDNDDIPRW